MNMRLVHIDDLLGPKGCFSWVNHTKRFIYVKIPKAGGTSMMEILGLDYLQRFFHPLDTGNYFVFTMIRHPIERFFSGFNELCKREYAVTKKAAFYEQKTREDKARALIEELYLGLYKSPYHFDPHIRPQKWFLTYEDGQMYKLDKIYVLEKYAAALTDLKERGCVASEECLRHLNKSKVSKISLEGHYIKLLEEIYKDDIELYNSVSSQYEKLCTGAITQSNSVSLSQRYPERLLMKDQVIPSNQYERIEYYLLSGKLETAYAECIASLKETPQDARLFFNLGRISLLQNRLSEAVLFFTTAFKLDQASVDIVIHYFMTAPSIESQEAFARYLICHLDEGITIFQSRIMKFYPSDPLKNALKAACTIAQDDHQNWKAYWISALVAEKLGAVDIGDRACQQVISLNKEFWFARELPKHMRGYYSQMGQDAYIEQYFSEKKPRCKVFVEVGAFDGRHYSNVRRLVERHGWKGISIEPVKKNYRKLVESYTGTEVVCINAAASNHSGIAEMNVSTYPHLPEWGSDVSSLDPAENERWTQKYGAKWEKQTVQVKTLTEILSENNVREIGLLSVDAEGHDLEVLQGLDFSKYKPEMVVVEYGDKKKEILGYLSSRGYQLEKDNNQDLFMSCKVLSAPDKNFPFVDGSLQKADERNNLTDFPQNIKDRMLITMSCRDCDDIPKVLDAGMVIKGDPACQIMHNGLKVIHGGYHGKWMSEIIRSLKGHHEPQEERAFYEILKVMPENAVMIELGSFWSYYSMWFKKSVPNAVNYMIEPNADKMRLGQENFRLNHFTGHFINAFIGRDCKPDAVFTDWDGRKYSIPKMSVDQLLKQNRIPFVHLLHSDIQGSEYEMLQGCSESIAAGKIGYMFISTHGDCHAKCIDYLEQNGFTVLASHTVAESFSADGLIVASSNKVERVKGIRISCLGKKKEDQSDLNERRCYLEEIRTRINPHLFRINYLPKQDTVAIQTLKPEKLINSRRFDILAKIIYGRFHCLNLQSNWGCQLYLAHIKAFNNFNESDGTGKIGPQAFIDKFHDLSQSFLAEGFNPAKSLIPIGNDSTIIDGSHRLALSYLLKKDVDVAVFNRGTNSYDYGYFLQRGLDPKYADAMAYEYVRVKKNTHIVTVFPSAQGKEIELVNIIRKYAEIVYRKDVQFQYNGPHLLVKQMYRGEPWLGNWSDRFKGAKHKADQCFCGTGPVRVFLRLRLKTWNS